MKHTFIHATDEQLEDCRQILADGILSGFISDDFLEDLSAVLTEQAKREIREREFFANLPVAPDDF